MMRKAYHADSALTAQGQLEALARELDKTHPNAAGSLREGLEDSRRACSARSARRTPSKA